MDDEFTAIERYRDEMCACRDTPCTQDVLLRLSDHNVAQSKKRKLSLTDEQQLRADSIAKDLDRCMHKAMGVPMPGSIP